MQDFEREVVKARDAWRRGEAFVILSFKEYLDLTHARDTLDAALEKRRYRS